MKFVIITHVEHKSNELGIFAYEPYVREMNLWLKYVDEVQIVAPLSKEDITSIESNYRFNKQTFNQVGDDDLELIKIPSFDITSMKNGINAIFKISKICFQIYNAMQWADHIHLRCPGNIGLLGCFVQILFPSKPKTVKYAGNWDPKSKQPLSYRLQKWIVSNTFLTKNCNVLVYGKWPKQSKNIVPFFTASYSELEIEDIMVRDISGFQEHTFDQVLNDEEQRQSQLDWASHDMEHNEQISNQVEDNEEQRHSQLEWGSHEAELNFLFVGGLTPGKQPLLSVQVIHELKKKGYLVKLDMYGEGIERTNLTEYILDNSLENEVRLHGNTYKEIVKKAYKEAHFLLFISKSEGWPKVVAEAMFWGCLPITSDVSCISYMLENNKRGSIVNPSINEIVEVIESYIHNPKKFEEQVDKAMEWSRQYTLEKFEKEVGKLLV
ncbi:glycosyltransferase family 4 protein [Lutibacter flavus]|uniref:Glycosyl transferases group 1 n=1 Tax=Lutibacter flavus TaxID=691689 RepID=A0A238VQ63_9FLAO|nr:glycosyltransferase [Lutibacter flavus]SNR36475.1 Glycosyl transferases group 1 [Lutibacter flavus]